TSEWRAEQITNAYLTAQRLNLIGPVVEQPQYNITSHEQVEKEYAPLYKKIGTGTTVFSLLGMLPGKYFDAAVPADSRVGLGNEPSWLASSPTYSTRAKPARSSSEQILRKLSSKFLEN
ncbi:hypothetical protein HK096_007718, partial [Nowakowskiella sp. JEL0078]